MRAAAISWVLLAGIAAGAGSGCTGGNSGQTSTNYKTRADMIAPLTCATCHEQHFEEWSHSAHAKAADDPVFLAMNARGQRETKEKLGTFCVECHAPMAVRDGKTDGRNLGSLDPNYKGVTCYFCHSIDGVEADGGKSNASVHLADDLVMRGELQNPPAVANPVHASAFSPFQNHNSPESAEMCGYCHDIDSPAGAPIERTFAEWSASPFATAGSMGGLTCTAPGTCHMTETANVAIADGGLKTRSFHSHDFSAVDVPVGATPRDSALVQQALNNNVLLAALCVTDGPGAIRVILDTNGVGHHWPSGAAQDRRAWTEVIAYGADNTVLYSSGVVPAGTSVTATATVDADLWLLRDCMFDSQAKETHNFWEAATVNSASELPGLLTYDLTSPNAYKSHIERSFPSANNAAYPTGTLKVRPARVTLRVLIQPVGLDVLNDLVDSGDLDPGPDGSVLANMPTFGVSLLTPSAAGGLEWPAPPNELAQNLVATVKTSVAGLGTATCTTSSGFAAIGQVPGTTAAKCLP